MEVDFDSIINHCDLQINLLKNKRLTEIKEVAKKREIKGYSKMKKDELIEILK